MDVQRELKLTNIQELSTLPEQVTISPTAERERKREHDKNRCELKRVTYLHGKRFSCVPIFLQLDLIL